MKRLHFQFSFLVLAWIVSFVGNAITQTAEDYKVYDAVIREMFRGGITQFDMNAKVEQIVIRDRTRSDYAFGGQRERWDQVRLRLRSLDDETIAGYELSRTKEIELKEKFEIPFKYSLISDKRLAEVFSKKDDFDKYIGEWGAFYKVFPKSAGHNSLSRVGYDKARRKALVYFVNWCRPACGTGNYVVVEKAQNGWSVKEWAGIWIS